VERLTDEAVALTFAVPRELWDEYAYLPGQHLTLRATIDGEDVRQSYSICQPRSGRNGTGLLRVASAVVEGGRMSTWLNSAERIVAPTTCCRSRTIVSTSGNSGIWET
jgi:ring-1,2-phenylacetyl-CoA epoxidase subunit PaaE